MPLLLGRRHLLRAGLAAAALPGLRGLAFAEGPAPLLVLVNLRGGMDGLHALSPADDRHLAELRPAMLRTTDGGETPGHRLDASPAADFRLHAEAGPLAAIWREGRMAIWPAAGLPLATRSHFEAQALMGLGQAGRGGRAGSEGWLAAWSNRARPRPEGLAALSAQGALAPELRGARGGVAIAHTAGGLGAPGGAFGERMLEALHGDTPGPVGAAGREALGALRRLDGLLPRDAGGRVLPYAAASGAHYVAGRELGHALSVVAQMARLNATLTAATVDLGGWDMHEGQPGRMAERMRALAAGLAAFDADLAELPRPWTVLVASEFGRRLRSNRSNGTDHGRAGLIFAFGGGAGRHFGLARHFGPWPGLAPEALEDGVDLRVATDYRDAFRAVIAELAPAAPPPFAG